MNKRGNTLLTALVCLFITLSLSSQTQTKDLLPPTDLTAGVFNGNDVKMEWYSPEGVGSWINWDQGLNNGSGIGLLYGGTFYIATRWEPADLEPYDGMMVTKFSFFPIDDPNATFELKAWTGAEAANLIMTQDVATFSLNEWNIVELNEPIVINASNELWLGYSVTHDPNKKPAGHDEGPASPLNGDLISSNGTSWSSMSNEFGWNYNWNFSAFVSPSSGQFKDSKPMIKNVVSQDPNPTFINHAGNGPGIKFQPPITKDFLGYNIYRNEVLIVEEIDQNAYFELNLSPDTYSLDVKAVYSEGMSEGAGPVEITIYNGVDRELVILEIATGTWCMYCPGAAMGADDLVNNGYNVGVIEYHYNDDYTSDETTYRLQDYYNVIGYPTSFFDGIISYTGGSNTTSLYDEFLPKYMSRAEIPSFYSIDANYFNTEGNNFQISINIEMIEEYQGSFDNLSVHAVLTESHIPEIWQGGLTEVNFVCRDMIPDHDGSPLEIEPGQNQNIVHDFTIPSEYNSENLELVVFIQDNNTHEILQGAFAYLSTNIEHNTEIVEANFYPTPANEILYLENAKGSEVIILDISGKVVANFQPDENLYQQNISHLPNGLYIMNITHKEQTIQKEKLIISK